MTDAQLLQLLKENDSNAIDQIFNRYYTVLVRHALKHLADPMVAEEIVQDLFIYLWKKRHEQHIDVLESYLFRSVKNKCLSHLKSKVIQIQRNTINESEINIAVQNDDLQATELAQLIERALSLLPKQTASIYAFSRSQGLTYAEIAEQLEVSKKTVEYHISSALRFLKSFLEKHGYLLIIAASQLQGIIFLK